jgi:hypothetical protein
VVRAASLTPEAAAGHGEPIGVSASLIASITEDNGNCIYVSSLSGDVFRLGPDTGPAPIPCPTASVPAGLPTVPAIPIQHEDVVPPTLRAAVPKRQRLLRNRGAIAYAHCDEACSIRMTARMRAGRVAYALRHARTQAAAGQRVRLLARLTRRAARAFRRGVARGRRAVVNVVLSASDPAGNGSARFRSRFRPVLSAF